MIFLWAISDGEDEDPVFLQEKAELWEEQRLNGTGGGFGKVNLRCGELLSWVPNWWLCDGRNHCRNGFDEMHCEQNKTCKANELLCDEGYNCIAHVSIQFVLHHFLINSTTFCT